MHDTTPRRQHVPARCTRRFTVAELRVFETFSPHPSRTMPARLRSCRLSAPFVALCLVASTGNAEPPRQRPAPDDAAGSEAAPQEYSALPGGVALAMRLLPDDAQSAQGAGRWFMRLYAAAAGDPPPDEHGDLTQSAEFATSWLESRPRDRNDDPGLQPELSAAMSLARDSASHELQQACLVAFGSALGPLRASRGELKDSYLASLRTFTLPPSLSVFDEVDGRFLPPLLEHLFDLQDFSAIERVSRSVNPRIVPPAVTRFRSMATESPRGTLRVAQSDELECELRVDGEPAVNVEEGVEVVPGSHLVECATNDDVLFREVVVIPVGGSATLALEPRQDRAP